MLTLPTVIVQEKNKMATPDPWVVLLTVELSADVIFYFCSGGEDVTHLGQTYTAFPFILDQARQTAKAEIPSVQLKVANVTQIIHSYLEDLDGCVGARVRLQVVNAGLLDQDFSELDLQFQVLGSTADAKWIVFTLGAVNPLRMRFPRFRHIALHCNWDFKGLECGYVETEGDANLVTSGSSATVTTSDDAFQFVGIGDTIAVVVGEVTVNRTVIEKTDSETVTVDEAVDWENGGTGYPFTFIAATCSRNFTHCDGLKNTARFGGYRGLNLKGWRMA